MQTAYRQFFALTNEPFASDVAQKDILVTPAVSAVQDRIQYAMRLGAVALLTGEVGSGKSTALRYAMGGLHPSEYRVLSVTASSGSILELYRLILAELGQEECGNSRALMTRAIRREVLELVQGKKMKTVLVIDEASLCFAWRSSPNCTPSPNSSTTPSPICRWCWPARPTSSITCATERGCRSPAASSPRVT